VHAAPADFARLIQLRAGCPCDRHDRQVDKALLEQHELFFAVVADERGSRPGVSMAVVDGLKMLAAFADPDAAQVRYPDTQIGSVPRAEVFDWILNGEPEGLVVYACVDDAMALWIPRRLRELVEQEADGSTVVPPGYSVIVSELAPAALVAPTLFGFLVVDFGPDGSTPEETIDNVAGCKPRTGIERTLWIVQARAASRWATTPGLVDDVFARIEALTSERAEGKDVAVIERGPPASDDVAERFGRIGLEVHDSGPDGTAFLVVTKPDGTHEFGWTPVDPRVRSAHSAESDRIPLRERRIRFRRKSRGPES
jgi:hypothetical protein